MALYSARVENALHTVLTLARAGGGAEPSARELAEFQRLPLPFVRRILTELAHGGVVTSSEGIHGGWRLAAAPEQITVRDVVDAVHGAGELFECREIRARCALWDDAEPPAAAVNGRCSIHAVMLSAETAMRDELGRQTIGDLARRVDRAATPGRTEQWFTDARAERVAIRTSGHDR